MSLRVLKFVLCGLAACSAPRPEGPAPLSPRPEAASIGALAPSPAPAQAPAPLTTSFVVTSRPAPDDLDREFSPADCDFARGYRGALGAERFSVVLERAGARLSGRLHFDDDDGPGVALDGELRDGAFFRLRGSTDAGRGVSLEGQCLDGGRLRALMKRSSRAESTAVELSPLPRSWPGLYYAHRRTEKKRDGLECSAEDTSLRVFGLDSSVQARVNELLGAAHFEAWKEEVKTCQEPLMFVGGMGIVAATSEFLSVERSGTASGLGAHPDTEFFEALTVDLTTGNVVKLEDVVTDVAALRDLAGECLGLYLQIPAGAESFTPGETRAYRCEDDAAATGRYLWGCPGYADTALWALTEDGILIGSHDNISANRVDDGNGPIIPYSVLERAGLLNHRSPAAHVWADVRAASEDDPACSSALEGGSLRLWSRDR